ncbi:MAG: YabP/YqfC family sporulation protein [Clostridia bacterium]|nr:YabP/YqfC family sporulation protein [Clostridia bacterium]
MTDAGKIHRDQNERRISALSSFHIEADRAGGGMSLIISGVIGISDFSDQFIHLLSHGGRIKITGKALFIRVYENNRVEIVGRIEGIVFSYGKN